MDYVPGTVPGAGGYANDHTGKASCTHGRDIVQQGSANFSSNNQIVNMFGFGCYKVSIERI